MANFVYFGIDGSSDQAYNVMEQINNDGSFRHPHLTQLPIMSTLDNYLDFVEVCAALKISDATLRRLIKQERLPPDLVLSPRKRYWDRDSVEFFITSGLTANSREKLNLDQSAE